MDLGALRTIARDIEWGTLGVDASVQIPGAGEPLETRGIWLTFQPEELPSASNLQRAVPRKVMAFRRDQVAVIPRGTVVTAPEISGGLPASWVVDGHLETRDDHNRVILIQDI